jgi:hypothetical protein
MLKSINRVCSKLGFEVHKLQPINRQNGSQIYQYLNADGSFNYAHYRQVQTAGNKRKIDRVWVKEENISFLSEYIRSKVGQPNFGICHGTRRGKEQEWFRANLACDVIGTEISDTADQFPHTIQWDFHETKPEWINAVDFIYSNSFDHSHDPERCLNAWMSCINKNGMCILEHTSDHERATELDPFGAPVSLMPYLILSWGKGQFYVTEILDAPARPEGQDYLRYIVIQKR